jgi:hypothetical protein
MILFSSSVCSRKEYIYHSMAIFLSNGYNLRICENKVIGKVYEFKNGSSDAHTDLGGMKI